VNQEKKLGELETQQLQPRTEHTQYVSKHIGDIRLSLNESLTPKTVSEQNPTSGENKKNTSAVQKLSPRSKITINKICHILSIYLTINDSKTPKKQNNNTTNPNAHTQRGFLF